LSTSELSGEASEAGAGRRSALVVFEVVATGLLALATVATAWSGYQATRWGGETTKAGSAANQARIDATRADDLANAQTQIDVATFSSWADAYARGETTLADFYYARFREEFKPAVVAWVATMPLKNPNAPLTPFVMPQYKLAAREEAARQDAITEVKSAELRRNVQRQSNYVLGVVLFATALFFAGTSTKLSSRSLRVIVLGLGVFLFLGTLIWIATFPVSVTV
jgi:hypothetical protein